MPNVLIKFPHGLGDCVQLSVVLRHLKRYRPDWVVDVKLGRGKHTALVGQCRRVYHDHEPEPSGCYDSVSDLGWFENYNNYTDRPCSKVTNCLREVFGLDWDHHLARYVIHVSGGALGKAGQYLRRIGCRPTERGTNPYNAVVIHYQGNTSPAKKNLDHWQAQALCDLALRAGRVPVILDWDRRSPLPDQQRIFNPGCGDGDIWGGFGSGDAELIAALIAQSEAFIGIDSGPGKVASATETPALICWKGHHPIQFHDPADNTTHLVPEDHRRVPPCCDDSRLGDFFEKNYRWQTYSGHHGLVGKAQEWLAGILKVDPAEGLMTGIEFVVPPGIGDIVWALLKIKSISGGRPIDVIVAGDPCQEIDCRALPFLRRFDFVRNARVLDVPILEDREDPADNRGRYRYVSDGVRGPYHFLIPNRPLEAGRRIEEWLSEHPVDWGVMDHFSWAGTERGESLAEALEPCVAFYLGPETGNVDEGHNRGFLWEPRDWVELGVGLKERGMNVAVVGANYDRSYWERYVRDGTREAGLNWIDLIGQTEVGEVLAFLRRCRCFISYQCGLGVVSHYLGGKVAMWWRPEGDSCHPKHYVSFDERMSHSWTNPAPAFQERYMPLVYRKCNPWDILDEIDRRGWLKD